jgi:L-malate glycosyltransferase
MTIRVLWVVKGLGPGGAERLLVAAAHVRDREKFAFDCAFVLPDKDHLVEDLEQAGVMVHCLGHRRNDRLWSLRLFRFVRNGNYDVVHVHSPLPGSVARAAALSLGRKRPRIFTTEHNVRSTFTPATRVLNRLTSRWDDTVFAVSDETLRSIRGGARKRANTLLHGVNISQLRSEVNERSNVRSELGLTDHHIVVGTVANFRPQKDFPTLLRAVAILSARRPELRWIIVGQGPLEADMRRLAASLGVDSSVIFTGFRPDATRIMNAFDIFTLSSAWEGLPVALMEALALGLPVAATRVGGIAEALDDEHALLVEPANPQALADAWERLVSDPALRRCLAQRSGELAPEFEIERTQRILETAYGDAANSNPRSDREPALDPNLRRVKHQRPGDSRFDVRPANAADREAIMDLLGRAMNMNPDHRLVDLYRWKHDLNPFGPSPTWVAVTNDRIVGVRVFMRWEFVRDGEVIPAVRAVDTATDPNFQGKGLFTTLTMHGLEHLRAEGIAFVFNTPNDASRPGYLKMGWRTVGRMPVSVRLRNPQSLLRLRRSRGAADLWSTPTEVGMAFAEWDYMNPVLEPAWPAGERIMSTNVTANFLRWRYGEGPVGYRVLKHDDGTLIVRTRRRGDSIELVHAHSMGLSPSSAARLLVKALQSSGADYALSLSPGLHRHGFVPLPRVGPILTWRSVVSSGMPSIANWSLPMGDIELF